MCVKRYESKGMVPKSTDTTTSIELSSPSARDIKTERIKFLIYQRRHSDWGQFDDRVTISLLIVGKSRSVKLIDLVRCITIYHFPAYCESVFLSKS